VNDGNNAGVRVNEVALAGIYFLGLGGGERQIKFVAKRLEERALYLA